MESMAANHAWTLIDWPGYVTDAYRVIIVSKRREEMGSKKIEKVHIAHHADTLGRERYLKARTYA